MVSEFEQSVGTCRVKRQFAHENVDEPIIGPKIDFEDNFFNNIFDIGINSINDRFEQIKEFF